MKYSERERVGREWKEIEREKEMRKIREKPDVLFDVLVSLGITLNIHLLMQIRTSRYILMLTYIIYMCKCNVI